MRDLKATIFLLLFCTCLTANDSHYFFRNIGLDEGLFNSTVISIVQDRDGLIWFATFDGLNKFDGYTIKVYRHEEGNENSLQSNATRCLYKDKENNLWIGTNDGLTKYIHEKDIFENFSDGTNNIKLKINVITDFYDNKLLLGTENGLYIFDKNNKTFSIFPYLINSNPEILSLEKIENHIIIGTDIGLYLYDNNKKRLTLLSDELKNRRIQAILHRSGDEIWVGTEGLGLFLINYKTDEILNNYTHSPNFEESICSDYIRTMLIDNESRLWIGTFHGLSLFNGEAKRFHNYYNDPLDETSISQNSIRSLMQDTEGGIWLGSYYGGVNYYHPLNNQFLHIKQTPRNNSLNDRIISPIVEDSDGTIWIGTNDKGVNIFKPDINSFSYLSKETNSSFNSNNIKSFLLSTDNKHIYIGSHAGGLIKLNKKTTKVVDKKLFKKDVYSLAYDLNNDIWVGTLTGLYKLKEKENSLEEVEIGKLSSNQVLYVEVDSKNRLWIGTDKSLVRFDIDENKLTEFDQTFQQTIINSIVEDSKGIIWIGTNNGLYKYIETSNTEDFIRYSEKVGLSNNMVFGIVEDSLGHLWISTNYGINRLDRASEEFKTYLITDGLQFHQFNKYSFCKTKTGRLYFGGVDGIITFVPEQLKDNPFSSKPIITELNVQNKVIQPSEGGILENNIINADRIKLKSSQATFSLRFAVPNYLAGKHNTFKYQLEGYDKDWIISSENHFASYSNLPPGSYKFKLLSANNEGHWSQESTEFDVIVTPLWFQTYWFRIFIILVILIIVFTLRVFFNQRQDIKKQLIEEQFEREKNEEINQAKMNFFVNISHEFRTPLTLIISPLQELIEKVTGGWEKDQLKVIKKNTDKLLHLTTQMIDYRRAELGVFELNIKRADPNKTILKTMSLFDRLAKRMNIQYSFENYTSCNSYIIDENYLDIILSNLLSNAFKFTPTNGKITVNLIEDLEYLILEVEDSGCGILENEQKLIFNRFHKVSNNNDDLGMGIGLSITQRLVDLHHGKILLKSKINEGSTFSIYFPQNENLYSEKELYEIADIQVTNSSFEINLSSADDLIISDKPHILLVEDNEELLSYMSENLSGTFNIVTAENGEEALEVINQDRKIDIIVSDIMMDLMDGKEMCKILKENISTCHIPIILLSAKSTIEDQLSGLGVGADDYLTKPFTISILKAKINNMLASRERILSYYSSSTDIDPEKIATNRIDNELLAKAKEIVIENLDNTAFTTELLSEEMGMSRTSLHLKLKALTGKSATDFIRKIRFNEAIKLLSSGEYNISEVSYMIGYSSLSYFSTSFKSYFGYTPSEYLKNIKHKQI